MKKFLLTILFSAAAIATLSAQNYIIVNSEKVFKSIDAYNAVITQLDELAKLYQAQVDAKFAEIETLYNNYQNQKATLSAATRQARENAILVKEKEANDFQQGIFNQDGSLMKRRLELIQPIQKKVFAAIEVYAKQVGAEMVLDSANNATLLYTAPKADHTQQVIESLK